MKFYESLVKIVGVTCPPSNTPFLFAVPLTPHSYCVTTRQFENWSPRFMHSLSWNSYTPSQWLVEFQSNFTLQVSLVFEFSYIKIGLSLMSCGIFSSASWINIWKNDLPFGKLNCRYNMTKNKEVFLKYIVYFQWIALLLLILLGHARTGF